MECNWAREFFASTSWRKALSGYGERERVTRADVELAESLFHGGLIADSSESPGYNLVPLGTHQSESVAFASKLEPSCSGKGTELSDSRSHSSSSS
nr:uncharacterized protein BN887_06199 [Melanopsichium pennsylvanicum 4]